LKSLHNETIPLRERKPAQIKLNLLKATIERMKETSFAEIAVKDLCAQVQVSEPTFFKYFPRKIDLLIYFFELWSIEAAVRALQAEGPSSGLAAIEEIFDFTARKFADNPRLMLEVVSLLAAARTPLKFPPLSRAERIIAFAGLPQALDIDPQSLEAIFGAYVAVLTRNSW
jgi:AcrR family transcriptional regulator